MGGCEDMLVDINGIPLDPHVWVDMQSYENVTVIISRCEKCGEINVSWKRQENTREIEV